MIARLVAALRRLLSDESGVEVLELALVLALIMAASLVVIGSIGAKVSALYTSVDSSPF